jgi:hypothetical protein
MMRDQGGTKRLTIGADKGYYAGDFVHKLREMGLL